MGKLISRITRREMVRNASLIGLQVRFLPILFSQMLTNVRGGRLKKRTVNPVHLNGNFSIPGLTIR